MCVRTYFVYRYTLCSHNDVVSFIDKCGLPKRAKKGEAICPGVSDNSASPRGSNRVEDYCPVCKKANEKVKKLPSRLTKPQERQAEPSTETRSRQRPCKFNSIHKIGYFLYNLLGRHLICPTSSDNMTDQKFSDVRIVVFMQPLCCLPIVFFHLLLLHAPPAMRKVTHHYSIHDRSKSKYICIATCSSLIVGIVETIIW